MIVAELPGVGPIPAGVLSTGMEWILGGGNIVLAGAVVYLFRELRSEWRECSERSLAQQREYHVILQKVDATLEKVVTIVQVNKR